MLSRTIRILAGFPHLGFSHLFILLDTSGFLSGGEVYWSQSWRMWTFSRLCILSPHFLSTLLLRRKSSPNVQYLSRILLHYWSHQAKPPDINEHIFMGACYAHQVLWIRQPIQGTVCWSSYLWLNQFSQFLPHPNLWWDIDYPFLNTSHYPSCIM